MGVKTYTVKGKKYRYWRRKGAPAVRMDPSLEGEALVEAIRALERKHLHPKPRPGTLRLLLDKYHRRSDHWASLRDRTRKDYDRVVKWLGPRALDTALVEFTTPAIARIRDRARGDHEPKFANQVVTVLKMVFAFGVDQGDLEINPAADVTKATGGNRRENRPLAPHEAVQLIDRAPAHLCPVIAIALYTGLRLGDIASLTKSADKGEWIEVIQGKSRRKGQAGKTVILKVCDDLRWILDGIGDNSSTQLCVKADGTPWTYEGIKTAFQRFRDGLEAPETGDPDIQSGVTFHGLRHTVATILGEEGFDEWQIGHQLGHTSKTVTGRNYVSAERRKLLTDMAVTIEATYREARGNVVQITNRNETR